MHGCAVQYCQKECQKKDYSRHKKECGALAVARGDAKQKRRLSRRELKEQQKNKQGTPTMVHVNMKNDNGNQEDHPAPLSGAKGENETTTSNTGKTKSNAGIIDQAFEKVLTACGKGQMKN